MSFSALVLIGNGNGSAGLGYGKALKVQDAVRLKKTYFIFCQTKKIRFVLPILTERRTLFTLSALRESATWQLLS